MALRPPNERRSTRALMRRLLPGIVGIFTVLGALRWVGVAAGLYPTPVGIVVSTTVGIAGALGVVGWAAHSLAQTEARLRQEEARFRGAFESAAIGMALVSPDGRFVEVNPSLCTLVGYTEEELLAATFQQITHPDDLDADLAFVEQMLRGEIATYTMEKRYFHRDGHIVWVLLSVSLVRDARGEPVHFVSQIEDVTERKRTEAALRESEARLAEAQKLAHVGSWEWDATADTITWSDELFRIFGFEPGSVELTLERYLACLHPQDRPLAQRTVAAAAETGEPFAFDHRIVRPDGGVRWVHGRGEVVRAPDGSVSMFGTSQDITERRAAGERVLRAERRFRTLVEQLPLVTYARPLDMGGANLYASPQVEELLGYPAAEWENDPGLLARIVHPDDRDRVLTEAERVRRTGEPFRGEYRYVARDGRIVWVQDETFVVASEDGGDGYVQGFLLDITERKRAEADRARLETELRHAQKLDAIGQLAGGVAHDFNNILTAVTGYSELLVERLEARSLLRSYAEEIRRAAEQAGSLTRQLLAFGRKQVLQPARLDLNDVVGSAEGLLGNLIGERYRLRLICDPGLGCVLADAGQIEHVIVNLVLNARDAMPDGGVISVETHIAYLADGARPAGAETLEPGRYAVVSVVDTGIGIAAETRARIFEPFFTTKESGKGSGLGLSTAYGIATQSQGSIVVHSESGRGSTFELYLPCVGDLADEARPSRMEPAVPRRIATVLLAEDREVVRDLAASVLEKAGYRVLAAASGEEALVVAAGYEGRIDLLLTDVVMPGLDGHALAAKLLDARPGTPVLYMSGYTDRAEIVHGAGDGAVAFLEKPFTTAQLVEKANAVLAAAAAGSGTGARAIGA